MEKLKYNYDELVETFKYSAESPTGLIKIDTGKSIGFKDTCDKVPKSIRVTFKGGKLLAHRVIWVLVHGSIDPTLDIDHIDGNPFNNRIDNLRLVEKKLNQRNRKKMKNNITGVTGVGFHRTGNNSGGYNEYVRAVWVDSAGKQKHKDFNVKKFPSFELAVEFAELYRDMKLEDQHTYTERHGK